ncbi:MAG: GNAT family N-acetyltransferase [Planctomycetota bacterium]
MKLRHVTDASEAMALAPALDRYAEEAMNEFRDTPLPPEVGRGFVERVFDDPHAVLVVAEDEGGLAGLLATAPFQDPLTGEIVPMIVLLHVEAAHRHRGLARSLVAEARRLLVPRGHTALAARAGHNDDALISMGERWGYLRHWELMLREG